MRTHYSAILIAPHTVAPCWVEKESVNRFIELKLKMTAVVQVLAEIKRFADEDMPEDNQLAAERKQAQKRLSLHVLFQKNLNICLSQKVVDLVDLGFPLIKTPKSKYVHVLKRG